MKFLSSAVVLLSLAHPYVMAFAPPMQQSMIRPSIPQQHISLSMVDETAAVGTDITVPYDAAARLAYDDWRKQYNKGNFDETRYGNFKNNYEMISVANVIAKKRARESGTVSLSLLTLNEYGDLSESEYQLALQNGASSSSSSSSSSSAPTTTSDVLSKALEAAELQTQASYALGEAADALAEEEQKLMEMLGLESLEELEIALDSLDGIAPDGGELDSANIAREARIRDAYLTWCKEYRKEPDESRYTTFSNNFLMLEQYAKESAKELTLNQYADFTKEEYEAMQSGGGGVAPTMSKPSSTTTSSSSGTMETSAAPFEQAMSGIEQILARAAKAAQGAKDSIESSLKSASSAAKSVDLTTNRDEILETASTGLEKVMEIAAKSIDAGLQVIDESATPPTPETEEQRAEREARMKALEEERIENERQAAEAREKRAAEIAQRAQQEALRRKEIEEERVAREKVMQAEAAKAQQQAEAAAIAAAKESAQREALRAAERAKIEAQAAAKLREQARAWEEQQKKLNAKNIKVVTPKTQGWTFAIPSGTTKPAPVKKSTPAVKKTTAPSTPSFSFFPVSSPQPAKKKVVVAPKKPAVTPKKTVSPSPTPFSFFQPATPSKKTATPAPAPKAAPPAPSFSFFSPPKPAAVKKITPTPVAPPAPKAFSFFGSSAPAPSPQTKPDIKVPNTLGSINLFAPKPSPKKDVKVPNRPGTISIQSTPKDSAKSPTKTFTLFNAPKVASVPVKKETPATKQSPTFSLFGSTATKKSDVAVPNRSGSLSVFGKKTPPPNVPVLSNWRQNADGSISGKVSNSKGFRAGTEITTSPVKKGAVSGSIVKTGSGSQYYLN